jgi:hypothetical protein
VHVLVTRDFGGQRLRSTVVRVGAAGRRASSLLAGYRAAPGRFSLFIDGVRAAGDPASAIVREGETLWLDLQPAAAARVAAVVGSYPQPFASGVGGKRLPVRLECAGGATGACTVAAARLRAAGVLVARGAPGAGGAPFTLRVLVGSWRELRGSPDAAELEGGAEASGVYAIPSSDGRALTTLTATGTPARRLTGDVGLLAALAPSESAPVWVLTGTDAAGVRLAASALAESTLQGRYALVLLHTGAVALPDRTPVPAR